MEKIYLVTQKEVYKEDDKVYFHDFILTAHKTKDLAVKFIKSYIEDSKEDIAREHANQIPKSYDFKDIDWDNVDFEDEVPCYLIVGESKIPGRGPFNYFLHIREMEVFED